MLQGHFGRPAVGQIGAILLVRDRDLCGVLNAQHDIEVDARTERIEMQRGDERDASCIKRTSQPMGRCRPVSLVLVQLKLNAMPLLCRQNRV